MTRTTEWVESTFGRFAWRDDSVKRGAIEILGEWERRNIVSIAPPFELRSGGGRPLTAIRCHRLIAPALARVLDDLKQRALCHLINTFDGCFVPRHIGSDPKGALSRHSWGIAVDVNARLFPYGSEAKQNPRLIEAFARQGFGWGGEWRTPDPMHFEVVDLAQPAQQIGVLVDDDRIAYAVMHDGRALAPVREIAEALGAKVEARIEEGEVRLYTAGYERL